jgi:pre-60S factor REI1
LDFLFLIEVSTSVFFASPWTADILLVRSSYHHLFLFLECLIDLEGLLGYCHEKIKLGHYCLYCEKMFPTWQGCQNHMTSKQHTKLRYEQGVWHELDPFYDFKKDDNSFLGENNQTKADRRDSSEHGMHVDSTDDDDGDWEDMPDGVEDVEGDEEMYDIDGYEKEIARFGLDVTPLGELVFPDGRIVGHRALRRYYNQRPRPATSNDAVVAAQHAAGERLYEGRVVNIGHPLPAEKNGGAGRGILVPLKDGAAGFSALSLYRYQAVIRKQRRDDDKGRRSMYRTTRNTNKMDKKANRLMTNVSVAWAKR